MNTSTKGINCIFLLIRFLFTALIFFITIYFYNFDNTPIDIYKSAASIIAQISITMVGFVLACLAILTTISHYNLIRKMQDSGHFYILLSHMFLCIFSFLVLTIISVVMLFHIEKVSYCLYTLIFLSIFSLLLLIDVIIKLWITITNLRASPQ